MWEIHLPTRAKLRIWRNGEKYEYFTSRSLMIAKQQPVLCKVLCVATMVVVGSGARLTQAGSWICYACARRQRVLLTQGQRRPIHLSYLKKQAEAAKAWQAQAKEIREGRQQGMLEILESRGYVGQIAGSVQGFRSHAWVTLTCCQRPATAQRSHD